MASYNRKQILPVQTNDLLFVGHLEFSLRQIKLISRGITWEGSIDMSTEFQLSLENDNY